MPGEEKKLTGADLLANYILYIVVQVITLQSKGLGAEKFVSEYTKIQDSLARKRSRRLEIKEYSYDEFY